MSLDVSTDDYWRSTARYSVRERCKFMFSNELLSDVKFVVQDAEGGNESMKKIPAHKFLLAISSPVFYAMFYGELAEKKDSIDISDCDHKSLLELFRFVYSDEVNLNTDNVMQVLYLAKKYMLPSLAVKCTEFLREKVDASNVFRVLPDVQRYEEKDLEDHCWEVIDKQANDAVKSDGFVTIEKPVLEELVERESLNVKEVELFKAVDCWASKECERQGLTAEGSVKRRILGERIVKAIRFPVMEQKEFADVVLDRDILTKEESFDMVKYFNSVLRVPVGFTESTRPGSRYRLARFEPARMGIGWGYSSGSDFLVVSVTRNIKLYSVRLFGSENNEYSVTLKVTHSNGDALATKTGTFMSELIQSEGGDYHGFDIVFEPPVIILEANLKYCFEALINGPPSWYGNGCLSRMAHSSGVTFVYTNRTATRTTWQKGQFSEFEFTLN